MAEQITMDFNFSGGYEYGIKEHELNEHEIKHKEELQEARNLARQFGLENRGQEKYGLPYSCTADDVNELMEQQGVTGNKAWMGSVFREKDKNDNNVWNGDPGRGYRYYSKKEGNHAREIRIWCLNREYLQLMGRI